MKFLDLNKKRHAFKTFNDKAVDPKDLRTAIEIATLAPSANNIQPWKFVIVKDKKDALAETLPDTNRRQVDQAPYVVALFSDTDLIQRARKIARIGVKDLANDQLEYFMTVLPSRYVKFTESVKGEYLALNSGLVAMNLALAFADQGLASNIILGFDKSVTNDVLDIDKRFRPELLFTVGYSDEEPEASYRLPVDNVIEER